jgi:hypothetical protein
MAKQEVKIQKTVYRGNALDRVVGTAFSTYVTQSPLDEVDTDTVEELFRLYDILALQIPAEGDTMSHRYLVTRSSEFLQTEEINNDIQPLLDEIAELREELLTANQQIVELNQQLTNG